MSINSFTFSGNCGKDLIVRATQSGKYIGTVPVPCKSGYGDHEKTSWIDCKILGDRANKLEQYLTKGTKVTVTGEFQFEQWEHDGKQYSKPVCLVRDIEWDSKESPAGGRVASNRSDQTPQQSPSPGSGGDFGSFDDNLPF